ncbi:MAG TPA: Rieske 2Fe-2S domain-containing protein [Steroidobacteraceae bacterium]|nr:Rieske 2Fe-2S domain-containing protein [Steroidobacteraceae bacterium]
MSWRGHRFAPAAGTPLCHIDAVPDGACKELRFGDGDDSFNLLLYRRGDEVRAYVNCCPHFSLPLNAQPDEFLLLRNSEIMCAYHCAVFRLDDGHCIAGPAEGMGLEPVPVRLDGALICLGTP